MTLRWSRSKQLIGLVGLTSLLATALVLPVRANGRIMEIQGMGVFIQRQGERTTRAAYVGTVVQSGDLVIPRGGARVRVQCRNPDGTFRHGSRTSVFGLADVCPNSARNRYSQAGRGEDDFLLFLENRFEYASQILTATPMLRWTPVEGADRYQVTVRDCGQAVFNCTDVVWQETIEGTTVVYAGTALEPGRNYELEVSAGEGADTTVTYLTMRRLDEAQIAKIQAAVEQPLPDDWNSEAQALARVDSYLAVAKPETLPPEGVGLVLDAITVLEEMATESETPYVQRQLGDLYLQAGLLDAAQEAYERTLSLTDTSEDLASRAAALVGLANIAAARGDLRMAELRLQQAGISYAFGGEGERLVQIGDWLAQLRSEMD